MVYPLSFRKATPMGTNTMHLVRRLCELQDQYQPVHVHEYQNIGKTPILVRSYAFIFMWLILTWDLYSFRVHCEDVWCQWRGPNLQRQHPWASMLFIYAKLQVCWHPPISIRGYRCGTSYLLQPARKYPLLHLSVTVSQPELVRALAYDTSKGWRSSCLYQMHGLCSVQYECLSLSSALQCGRYCNDSARSMECHSQKSGHLFSPHSQRVSSDSRQGVM